MDRSILYFLKKAHAETLKELNSTEEDCKTCVVVDIYPTFHFQFIVIFLFIQMPNHAFRIIVFYLTVMTRGITNHESFFFVLKCINMNKSALGAPQTKPT